MVEDYISLYEVNQNKKKIEEAKQELAAEYKALSKKMRELGMNASDIVDSDNDSLSKAQKVVAKFSKSFKPGTKHG